MQPPSAARRYGQTAVFVLALALTTSMAPSLAQADSGGMGATITKVQGDVDVVLPGKTSADPARADMRIEPGTTIRTRETGLVELQFDDRSLLRLDHNSEVRILTGPEQRGVMVTLGKIWAKVQTVLGMSKFRIDTPTVVAGVRGTIVRAEVTGDEATIAVDEGEVEVAAYDEAPIMLRRNQMVQRRRGGPRGMQAVAFDPGARRKWEFWTDPLVQQEIKGIEEAAFGAERKCEEGRQRAREIFQALSIDSQAARRLTRRVLTANLLVASVQQAVAAQAGGPPSRPGRAPQPLTRAEARERLNGAERIYAECSPLFTRGRQVLNQHMSDVDGLRDAVEAHQEAMQTLQQRLAAFRRRREVDPHWDVFRPPCDQSEVYRAGAVNLIGEASPLLSRDVPEQLGDDPKGIKTIQRLFAWAYRTLDTLEKQTAEAQAQIARLRPATESLPETLPAARGDRAAGPGSAFRPGLRRNQPLRRPGGPGPRPGARILGPG